MYNLPRYYKLKMKRRWKAPDIFTMKRKIPLGTPYGVPDECQKGV
jgi:hypothetical protein